VWLAVGRTDMRRGMNGLALQVQEALARQPAMLAARAAGQAVARQRSRQGDGLSATVQGELDRVSQGDQAREAQLLNALFPLLDRDRAATLALFEIIKNQPGY
jgi:type I restriction enzyme R subunit